MNKKLIHGYLVYYDEDAIHGVDHLSYTLSFEEAQSMFLTARRSRQKIDFEDRIGRNFVLISRLNGDFEIKKRGNEGFSLF